MSEKLDSLSSVNGLINKNSLFINYNQIKENHKTEKSFEYYNQPHELEAQLAGFRRRAKKEKRNINDVSKEWFEKYLSKHNLSADEIETTIKNILNNGR
mgnify:CR=1 FL=1